jgi:methylated-DNA-protein-cysteine methyltransferase-like protein
MMPPRKAARAEKDYSPVVRAILDALRSIPRGVTVSYGEVARRAGRPRNARQVARVLHALSESLELPWHRVIGSSGRISLPMDGAGALQARLLRKEGVAVDPEGKVLGKTTGCGRRGGSQDRASEAEAWSRRRA